MYPHSPSIFIALVSIISTKDALGSQVLTIKDSKGVVGMIKSITSSEYQTAALLQKKYDFKVVLQAFVYNGQKFAIVNDKVFKIERTYVNGQFIELYLTETDIKREELRDEHND